MRQRRITEDDIKNAIKNHTVKEQTPENSYKFEGPDLAGNVIKVWCPMAMSGPKMYIINSTARKGE